MSQPAFAEGQQYAGQRLGLPEDGPGAVAGWGRRIVALFIDWFASLLVVQAIAATTTISADTERALPLVVFLLQVTLFTALVGGSFAQVALRIAVVRLDRRPVTVLQALVRTFLICLVIPPVVFNRDNRGLHDLAVGTITVNR
jgi:uncharacterized RDD family membrane protein YckC